MSFDLTLQPLGMSIGLPQEEDNTELEIVVLVALMVPGPQGPMPIPLGNIRFPVGRDFGISFAEKLKEEAEKLKKTSDIAVASSLSDIDHLAEQDRKLRGS